MTVCFQAAVCTDIKGVDDQFIATVCGSYRRGERYIGYSSACSVTASTTAITQTPHLHDLLCNLGLVTAVFRCTGIERIGCPWLYLV